jgi:hypothetical protein
MYGATVCSSVLLIMCLYSSAKLLAPAVRTVSPVSAIACTAATSPAASAARGSPAAAALGGAAAAAAPRPAGYLVSAMKPAMAPMVG